MKPILTIAAVILILYFLKVPGVVTFVNNLTAPLLTFTNYAIDVGTHIRERHPFVYIGMWFLLLFLMRPEYDSYSFRSRK